MKKNIILGIVFLLSLSIASAQEVVRRGDKHYMFRESTTTKRPLWGTYIPLAPTYGQVYQTADSVLVYGIAFTFRSYTSPVDDNSETSANPIFTEDDFSVDPNNGWAIIADVKGFNKNRSDLTTDLPTFSKKDSVNFESHSQMRKVLFQYEYDINTFKNASSDVVNNTTRCYEFYFDKPVWVANDFYVGYSMKEDKETFDSTLFYPFMWLAREELDYILPSHYYFNNYGDYLSGSNSWKYYQYEFFSWGGVFPIIGLVCGEMSRPQITEVGSSYALMTWDQQGEYDPLYEVAIYDAETDTLFYSDTTGNTHYYFDSLYSNTSYYASVRKRCRIATPSYEKIMWGAWTDVLTFTTGEDSSNPPIEDTTGVQLLPEEDFSLSPNPTNGIVQIALRHEPIGTTTLLLFDMQGRELMHMPINERRINLDLSNLPPAPYLLKLLTPRGMATRRVVKQ